MSYNPTFLSDLQTIINLVQTNKIDGPGEALEKFKIYLDSIKNIGTFNKVNWQNSWRKKVYEFGTLFSIKDPTKFFIQIESTIQSLNKEQKESILFVRSEMIWNYFQVNPEFLFKDFEELCKEYPLNPEFYHSLSHVLDKKRLFKESISAARTAVRIEEENETFLVDSINKDTGYIDLLLRENKPDEAEEALKNANTFKPYMDNGYWRNLLVSVAYRITDHLIIKRKIEGISATVKEETEKERRRLIEILGVFSAILAFVLVNTTIGKNFSINQALLLMMCMGAIMIIFSISISYIFMADRGPFHKSHKFYILLLLLIFLIIVMSTAVNNWLISI